MLYDADDVVWRWRRCMTLTTLYDADDVVGGDIRAGKKGKTVPRMVPPLGFNIIIIIIRFSCILNGGRLWGSLLSLPVAALQTAYTRSLSIRLLPTGTHGQSHLPSVRFHFTYCCR